ncbi:histidine phosphatase family protein [Deinococcus arenicola]|uniref:Histidine phosphatase family protein n=1 Tax=Deinococcus arenicola TaxID=2994950 RepID=A0ABU4DNK9_9DEIO|nr:histidine phosphatase family protein [Deinococcus sp. ZS9-10]MDV6374011.1 histidine phosphatase family protein [Deinococcus sp. ZS9-10]
MTPSRLFLARHGQTTGNVAGILRGVDSQYDELTDQGHAQAQTLAQQMAVLNPELPRVYASTYTRAQQTAAPVAELLGVPVTVLDGLQEIDPGDWRGRPYSDLSTHLDDLIGPGDALAFPGGESQKDVADRFEAALKPILDLPGTPIVVSHGGALISVLIRLLRVSVVESWRSDQFAHGNATLTELQFLNHEWHLKRLAAQSRRI